ncbi:MAG TPA: DUF4910 domain-containing protein [Thermoanaerobaculia bacterium]|jgi:hypothetical protein
MRKAVTVLFFVASPLFAANHIIDQKTFDAIAAEYSGERAQENDRRIVQYHRIQASPMMHEVAERVVAPALRDAGLDPQIDTYPSDGKLLYQTYITPMGWSIREGELWIEGDAPQRLCRYSDVPMCVSTYSKGGEWSGELVDVGSGTIDSDYEGKDVRGKVALASGYAADVVRIAVLKRGAVGTVVYPPANDRPDHPDMVRYNGVWTRAGELPRTSGSFQISANQYAQIKSMMAKGPVRVRGRIDATLGPGELTLVHARIRGTESPGEEVIISGHLDHPKWSANDNASGSAAMMEIARTLQTLIALGKLSPPRKTIHLIWVPEYFGTIAYLTVHPEIPAHTIANLNLDMVGEDTVKTNCRFYITRAPMSVPSFLDALLPDVLQQTREANLYAPTGTHNWWPAEVIPYFQGSDHDMFLAVGVPATMFGHDPDWTHHTSEDTVDKTDASEFKRVGVLAAAAAYWIASATDAQWQQLAPAVTAERLRADSERLVQLKRLGHQRLAAQLEKQIAALTQVNGAKPSVAPTLLSVRSTFAKRNTIGPIAGSALETLQPDDKRWIDEQRKTHPNFDLLMFEALGFMDGRHSNREIADLLTIEFGEEVGESWVSRLASILGSLKLVQPENLR